MVMFLPGQLVSPSVYDAVCTSDVWDQVSGLVLNWEGIDRVCTVCTLLPQTYKYNYIHRTRWNRRRIIKYSFFSRQINKCFTKFLFSERFPLRFRNN